MRKRFLVIYDVSSMLYAGECGSRKPDLVNSDFTNTTDFGHKSKATSNGLPVGGIRYLLNSAFARMNVDRDVLFVFDSPTDKYKDYPDYKGNRARNPAVYVQQLMFLDFVKKVGLPYLKRDNYEADDLVAAAVSAYAPLYEQTNIYTGDTDLAANIHTERINVVGSASIYPTISKENFELTVKRGLYIPWNMILPYYLIYGKQSNNVPAVADKSTCDQMFEDFKQFAPSSGSPAGWFSSLHVAALWIQSIYERHAFSDELIDALLSRTAYVYPRPLAGELPGGLTETPELNSEQLSFFLKVFNLPALLNMISDYSTLVSSKTNEMNEYIQRYKREYESGLLSVDNDMTADMSYFTTGPTTTEVFDQGDF